VPTAATAVARGLRAALNAERATARAGLAAVPLVRIAREVTTSGDYGTLQAADREQVMVGNVLSFASLGDYDPDGTHLIVVDDVKVTGAHQRAIEQASRELPLGSRTFLHIAAIDAGPAEDLDPSVEDRLNHAQIRTLDDLAALLGDGGGGSSGADGSGNQGFTWNIRVCKFLLGAHSREALPRFLARMPDRFISDLYRHSLSDGYAAMDAYRDSFLLVARELRERGCGVDRGALAVGPLGVSA